MASGLRRRVFCRGQADTVSGSPPNTASFFLANKVLFSF